MSVQQSKNNQVEEAEARQIALDNVETPHMDDKSASSKR